jgi:hypothetical protein
MSAWVRRRILRWAGGEHHHNGTVLLRNVCTRRRSIGGSGIMPHLCGLSGLFEDLLATCAEAVNPAAPTPSRHEPLLALLISSVPPRLGAPPFGIPWPRRIDYTDATCCCCTLGWQLPVANSSCPCCSCSLLYLSQSCNPLELVWAVEKVRLDQRLLAPLYLDHPRARHVATSAESSLERKEKHLGHPACTKRVCGVVCECECMGEWVGSCGVG